MSIFEWNVAHSFPPSATSLGMPNEARMPPQEGFHKPNFDGAVNLFSKTAGVGEIVRDHKGELIAAYKEMVSTTHPLEVELQSLLQGVIICQT